MGGLVGIGEPAGYLGQGRGRFVGHKGEMGRVVIAGLKLELGKIQRTSIHPGRGTGLKAHEGNARPAKRLRQLHGWALAVGAAVVDGLPDDDPAPQIRPRSQDDRFSPVDFSRFRRHALHRAVFDENFFHEKLLDI